eukprot:scaffold189537_cov43-Prasinocladus_malaysianus.AAC.2
MASPSVPVLLASSWHWLRHGRVPSYPLMTATWLARVSPKQAWVQDDMLDVFPARALLFRTVVGICIGDMDQPHAVHHHRRVAVLRPAHTTIIHTGLE